MTSPRDVVVVGAGVGGLATAVRMAARGHATCLTAFDSGVTRRARRRHALTAVVLFTMPEPGGTGRSRLDVPGRPHHLVTGRSTEANDTEGGEAARCVDRFRALCQGR